MKSIIALITDFGTMDTYVGVMKAVILSIEPECQLIDLTHEVPPGDIRRGAFFLWQSQPYFPHGTIFLCVVDPGVGTSRKAIALQTKENYFIGPNNGLFTYVCGKNYQVRQISNPAVWRPDLSSTFHGRDIFAPAAGHLAKGFPFSYLGDPLEKLELLPYPRLEPIKPNRLKGEILFADRFGNLITSFGIFHLVEDTVYRLEPMNAFSGFPDSSLKLDISKSRITLPSGGTLHPVRTFSDLKPGECGFLIGSSGFIELVSYRMSAKELLRLPEDAEIQLITENPEWKNS